MSAWQPLHAWTSKTGITRLSAGVRALVGNDSAGGYAMPFGDFVTGPMHVLSLEEELERLRKRLADMTAHRDAWRDWATERNAGPVEREQPDDMLSWELER
jgi:hypothetical protein